MQIAFQPRDSDDEAKEEKNADGDAKSRWDTDANLVRNTRTPLPLTEDTSTGNISVTCNFHIVCRQRGLRRVGRTHRRRNGEC